MSDTKDSLLFSLFNRSKKAEKAKEIHKEEQDIQLQEKPKAPPEINVKVRDKMLEQAVWNNLPITTNDERCNWLHLWIDTKLMLVKALRRQYIAPIDETLVLQDEQEKQSVLKLQDLSREKDAADTAAAQSSQADLDKDASDAENTLANALEPNIDAANTNSSAAEETDYTALAADATKQSKAEGNSTVPAPPPEWDLDFLHAVLNKENITFGINETELANLLTEPYETEYIIARGLQPIDGENGMLSEYFSRDGGPHFETRPDGSIDFKNMHLVTNVTKGTVICEISAPTQGTEGTNVRGEPLTPKAGSALLLPRGENTEILEEPPVSKLIASLGGNLVYRKDRYCVDNVYKVDGNVDNATGNIDFMGDVVVTGDVLEGYEIRTPRSIRVFGMVEGASLYAGEQINLEKGINGMSKGILQAGKEITAKFIENCNVYSGSDITSESIINSTVECNSNIKVTGKGLITGGKMTAFGSVEAKVIGSRSSTPTTIILGITPSIVRERNEVNAHYKDINNQYMELNKNINYVTEQRQADPHKEDACAKLLATLHGKLTLVQLKKQRLERRREELEEEVRNVGTCTLTCKEIFPPARVSIGTSILIVKESHLNVRFYRNSDGEISMGSS